MSELEQHQHRYAGNVVASATGLMSEGSEQAQGATRRLRSTCSIVKLLTYKLTMMLGSFGCLPLPAPLLAGLDRSDWIV